MRNIASLKQNGSTLIEVLVAIALAGIMLPALAAAIITSNYDHPENNQQLLASGQLNLLIAAVRSVREAGWNFIASDGVYHPVINGNSWSLAAGPETVGAFSESVTISDAERDLNWNIVASGYNDPATKQIVANVSWTTPTSSALTSTIYLTRWQNESSWTQTSVSDFSSDTPTNVLVSNISGGEVQLKPGQTTGSLESVAFDAGADVSYNYVWFSDSLPNGATFRVQVATNNDGSTWDYVGPDGTAQSWYYGGGPLPLSLTNARYFRFVAYFTSSSGSSPILDDVTVDYSK
jgi:prepilin-type N-terminal cleavage/methylation domain-containing protein